MKFDEHENPYNGNVIEQLTQDLNIHHLYKDGEFVRSIIVDVSQCVKSDKDEED